MALVLAGFALAAVAPATVSASGKLLVYTGNGGTNDGYSQFASAAGRTATTSPVLPLAAPDWDQYACVLLPVSTVGYTPTQRTDLNSYMSRGGTVVAIAEHLNADQSQQVGPASVTTLNNVAAGTGIQALNTSRNQGPTVTTNPSLGSLPVGGTAAKYRKDVVRVGFASTTTMTVTAPAVSLLETVKTEVVDPDPAPFLAIREIGTNQGKFVYSGDSSVFSDGGGGYFAGNDNGKLARNICGDINPPTITITTPQDGARHQKDQVLPAAWTCTDPDSDVNTALTTATTPVGEPIDTNIPGTSAVTKTFTVSCTDTIGNSATKTVSYIVGNSSPVATIDTPIDGGTYNRSSLVPASWSCVDPDGAPDIASAEGTVATGLNIDTVMPAGGPPVQKSFTVTCTDQAGSTDTKTVTYTVADENPPVATITSPIDGARFTIDKVVNANWGCSDPDGPQDIDPDENKTFGTLPNGQPVDTTGVAGQTIAKSFTVVCTDRAGNTTTKTHTYYIDGNPPVVAVSVPADGGTYMRGSSQPANWACTDPDGDADVKTKVATLPVGTPVNTGTPGSKAFTVTCADQAGNVATKVVTYTVIGGPPEITITIPADNASFAQGQVVSPSYSCSDPDGDLKSCVREGGATGPIDTSSAGTFNFTVNASDVEGNTSSKTVSYVVLDASAPSIAITTPVDGGRYRQGQVVLADYACSDADGPSDVKMCSGPAADGAAIDTSTPGAKTFTVNAEDQAGNTSSKTVSYVVDGSAPSIAITTPVDGGRYRQGQVVLADYACSDADGPSDVKMCSGPAADGAAIDTSTPGAKTFTVNAEDQAGNTSSKTVSYTVDASPPPLTYDGREGLTINKAADYTNNSNVTLTVRAPSGATRLLVSNDGGFGDPTTLSVAATGRYPWRLRSSGNERLPKVVYLRFVGGLGIDAKTFSDDIILDQTRPRVLSATLADSAQASSASRRPAIVRVRASDNLSGIAGVQITSRRARPGKTLPTAREFARSRAVAQSFRVQSRARRLWVRAIDRAGNTSEWRAARG